MVTLQLSQKNPVHVKLSERTLSTWVEHLSQLLGQPSGIPMGPQSDSSELFCGSAAELGGYRFLRLGLSQRVEDGRSCVPEDLLGFMAYPQPCERGPWDHLCSSLVHLKVQSSFGFYRESPGRQRYGGEKRIHCSELDKMSISPVLNAVGVLPRFLLPGRGLFSPSLWSCCVGC